MGKRGEIKKKLENEVFSILFPKMPSNFHIFSHNNITSGEKNGNLFNIQKEYARSARKNSLRKNIDFKGVGINNGF